MGRVRMWLKAVVSRTRFDRDMRDEMDAHIAQATARFQSRGAGPSAVSRWAATPRFALD